MGDYRKRAASGQAMFLCLMLLALGCQKTAEVAPPPPEGGDTTVAAKPDQEPVADEVELEYWRTVKDSEHSDDLWAYLERYPNGAFVDLAKSKLERLMKGATTAAKTETAPPPPPAAAPPDSAPTQRRSREQIVKDVIRREVGRFREPRLHIAPDIPRHKRDNAATLHSIDPSDILLLYDDGLSGGGKTGFCLTDRKVYWRFVSGSPAYFLDYGDIDQIRVRQNKLLINGYEVSVTMASDPSRAAETFADLLEEIRDQLRRR